METIIRGSRPDDFEQVYRLNCEAFAECWSREGLQQSLELGMELFVCMHGEELAGYILSQDVIDEVHIMQVAVSLPYRRLGIAEKLSLFLMREKTGMHTFRLEVRASNKAAQALYAKLGYKLIGCRPDYYVPAQAGGEREDALLMSLVTTSE